jgi:formate hydrogenlyase transcriptional activator
MRTERRWPPALLERLRSVAHMVAGVLARRDTDRQLRAALAENEQLRARLEHENRYLLGFRVS